VQGHASTKLEWISPSDHDEEEIKFFCLRSSCSRIVNFEYDELGIRYTYHVSLKKF
jgi:hypothetical protein